ncbi:MAG: aminotransferase class I/II-fold pyridoxal phosphate-dependent enzyme [Candidatus Methanoperedens sp.]|nr:aminotransferase class I/II-fold pyridoxal phosphate-dependent enzyme [Candidatus Methanoperedens sp.]
MKATYDVFINKNVKEEFEQRIKDYLQTNKYLITSSGRRALYIALKSLNIGKGDEVILPAFTSDIVPMVIRESGATPIPADVKLEDYNINTDSVLDRISNKTKAILTVHTFGCPSDLKALKEICEDHNLFLIEDAAPAFGAKYNGKPVGTFGDFGIISFGIGKSISMGGGGGIIAQNEELFKQINAGVPKKYISSVNIFVKIMGSIILSNPQFYGIIGYKIKDFMISKQYDHYTEEIIDDQDISLLSYAIGIQEIKLAVFEKRRKIALEYTKVLKKFDGVYPPVEKKDTCSVYSRYFVRVESEAIRTNILERMKTLRIEPLMPDNGYPISKNLYPSKFCDKIPNSLILSKTLIGIPVHIRTHENKLKEIFQ